MLNNLQFQQKLCNGKKHIPFRITVFLQLTVINRQVAETGIKDQLIVHVSVFLKPSSDCIMDSSWHVFWKIGLYLLLIITFLFVWCVYT